MYGENTKHHSNPYIQGTTVPCDNDWCGTVLEQRVPRTGLCMWHGCCRVGTAARANSVIATHFRQTRLRCKCKDQFKMYIYIDVLYIFATSGGVYALTSEARREGVAPLCNCHA